MGRSLTVAVRDGAIRYLTYLHSGGKGFSAAAADAAALTERTTDEFKKCN